jgi:hypothetical protein
MNPMKQQSANDHSQLDRPAHSMYNQEPGLPSTELGLLHMNEMEALLSSCVVHRSNGLVLGYQALSAQSGVICITSSRLAVSIKVTKHHYGVP